MPLISVVLPIKTSALPTQAAVSAAVLSAGAPDHQRAEAAADGSDGRGVPERVAFVCGVARRAAHARRGPPSARRPLGPHGGPPHAVPVGRTSAGPLAPHAKPLPVLARATPAAPPPWPPVSTAFPFSPIVAWRRRPSAPGFDSPRVSVLTLGTEQSM